MEKAEFLSLLKSGAEYFGLSPDADTLDKLYIFKTILLEYNKNVNLTALTTDIDFLVKHFLDSLSIIPYIPENAALIDIGTGAGFPGVPIALCRPDVKVALLDSLAKRLKFLELASKELDINASPVHGRAEDIGHDSLYREKFDIAVSRAVARLPLLSELSLPFVKTGGAFAAMKGSSASEETREALSIIKTLGGSAPIIKKITLPHSDITKEEITRRIILIKKLRQTPPKYPESSAKLSKKYKKNAQ